MDNVELFNAGLTAVSTVGFPIAACYIMFTYMKLIKMVINYLLNSDVYTKIMLMS